MANCSIYIINSRRALFSNGRNNFCIKHSICVFRLCRLRRGLATAHYSLSFLSISYANCSIGPWLSQNFSKVNCFESKYANIKWHFHFMVTILPLCKTHIPYCMAEWRKCILINIQSKLIAIICILPISYPSHMHWWWCK